MILAVPWLLWLLPLAGIPIAWHLLLKPQRRAAAFPTLMFFLSRQPRLEQRRKLREWLILALRVLLLALLIGALAGPRLPAAGGGGAPALAIIVDTSASMGLPDGTGRPLARVAAETAAALVDALPAGGRAVIVPTAPDPALALAERTSAERAPLLAALDRLAATEAASDAAGAIARAAAALADDTAVDREIRILSDLQAGEWDVAARLPPLPAGVRVTVHPLRPRGDGAGVDLLRVLPPPGRTVAGRPARLTAELANRGRSDATVGLRIATAAGESLHEVHVAAGGSASVPVLITADHPGPAWAWLTITGGGVAARGGAAVWAQDRLAVLLCGPAAQYGPLPLALAPDGSGELTGLVPAAYDTAGLPRAGLVVATRNAVPDVRAWVEAGGTLLLLPASAPVEPGAPPAWTGLRPLTSEHFTTAQGTVLADAQARCWEHVRDAGGAVEARLKVMRAWPLAGEAARTALALADGRPLLMERDLGKGLVVGLGVAFHPGWSDLPLKGWSLALLHGLALRGAAASRAVDHVAGAGFPPAPGDKRPVQLRTLAGGPGDWQGPRERLPPPVRAGVYQLDGLGEPVIVAVRAAPGEGVPRYAGADAALLAGLGARSVPISSPADAVADWRQQRRGLDLAPWLLVLAMLAWLAEGVIAARGAAMIAWSPALPPALLAVTVLATAALLWWSRRTLRARVGHHRLWWPRLGLGVLLLLALAGPRWRYEEMRPPAGSLAILLDTSSSMDLRDGRRETRLERARALAARLRTAAPSGLGVEVLAFDTRLRGEPPASLPAGERPGDPAAILAGLAGEARLAGRAGLVMLSDGGDEPIALAQPPGCPLWIAGFGPAAGATPDNLVLALLDAPASAEVDSEVNIAVEVAASGGAAFLARQGAVPVTLEEGGREVGRQVVDLRGGRARTTFTRRWAGAGAVRLRTGVAVAEGEASGLDNRREAVVEVRQRGLHVLFFTREVGAEFRALRQELGRDPGLTFTALLRTVASERLGDRYGLLGERLEGDAALERGFPGEAAGLARYGVIILGAFDPAAWRPAEAEALRRHVEAGAGVIVLAGDSCAAGGALAPLAPCPPLGGLERGSFPLAVPAAADGHMVVEGLAPLFAGASVGTLARLGPPRAGATVALAAGSRPLLAVQAYGRGRSALVASNTLWRLAGPGPAGEGYGRLWRQLVRWCAGSADAGGDLRVRWDKERYRPGEEAVATILPASGVRVVADLTAPDGTARAVALEPAPDDGPGALRARLRLGERGTWKVRVEGRRDGGAAETLERILDVMPRQGEGARLIPDHAALARAAEAGGGAYYPEDQAGRLADDIAARLAGAPVAVERAPLHSAWLLLLALALLVAEWSMRRKAGIV